MKRQDKDAGTQTLKPDEPKRNRKNNPLLQANIGDSLDLLVEYLVDNDVEGIHPLIMGEVEKRLIIKVLERSRGNKLQAAKRLGLSRNTFCRKIRKLADSRSLHGREPKA
jgi:DNA-binding protein Fis